MAIPVGYFGYTPTSTDWSVRIILDQKKTSKVSQGMLEMTQYTQEDQYRIWKWWFEKWFSSSRGVFSGSMLIFGGVTLKSGRNTKKDGRY